MAVSQRFNSRTPGGVRLSSYLRRQASPLFQFTHPGRGATLSIHRISRSVISFNSRTPGGVRRKRAPRDGRPHRVSIHAPREGCDGDPRGKLFTGTVSIHAPREGCDLALVTYHLYYKVFQFTHPWRGATLDTSLCCGVVHVSIHAPREGCDCIVRAGRRCRCRFNSRTPGGVRPDLNDLDKICSGFQFTHPGRGATHAELRGHGRELVSIHAPREGCDSQVNESRHGNNVFQFTHPGRGATVEVRVTGNDAHVSIHAPREGCDVVGPYSPHTA